MVIVLFLQLQFASWLVLAWVYSARCRRPQGSLDRMIGQARGYGLLEPIITVRWPRVSRGDLGRAAAGNRWAGFASGLRTLVKQKFRLPSLRLPRLKMCMVVSFFQWRQCLQCSSVMVSRFLVGDKGNHSVEYRHKHYNIQHKYMFILT